MRNWEPEGRAALLGALSPRAAARRQSDRWSVQSVRVRSGDGDGVRGYSAPGITYKMRLRARAPLRLPGLYPTKQTLYYLICQALQNLLSSQKSSRNNFFKQI